MSANYGNPFRQGDIYDQTWFASLSYLQLFQHDLTEILSILQQSQDARGKEQKEVPMVLLGNKGDMVHLRQVSSEEGDLTMIEIILDIQILPWRLNTLKRTFNIQNLYKIGLNDIFIFAIFQKCPQKYLQYWLPPKFEEGIRPLAMLRDPGAAHFYFSEA